MKASMTTAITSTSKALAFVYVRLSDQIHSLIDLEDEQALEQAVQQRQELLITITNWVNNCGDQPQPPPSRPPTSQAKDHE